MTDKRKNLNKWAVKHNKWRCWEGRRAHWIVWWLWKWWWWWILSYSHHITLQLSTYGRMAPQQSIIPPVELWKHLESMQRSIEAVLVLMNLCVYAWLVCVFQLVSMYIICWCVCPLVQQKAWHDRLYVLQIVQECQNATKPREITLSHSAAYPVCSKTQTYTLSMGGS